MNRLLRILFFDLMTAILVLVLMLAGWIGSYFVATSVERTRFDPNLPADRIDGVKIEAGRVSWWAVEESAEGGGCGLGGPDEPTIARSPEAPVQVQYSWHTRLEGITGAWGSRGRDARVDGNHLARLATNGGWRPAEC
jgi:hypothetical protein